MRYGRWNSLLGMVVAAVFTAAAVGAAPENSAKSNDLASTDGLASADGQYPEWLDRAVPPRLDFFRYANGGWIKANPMPPDRSYWGVDTLLEEKNQSLIRDLLASLRKEDSGLIGSVQR